MRLYELLFRHVIARFDAERAHGLGLALLRVLAHPLTLGRLVGAVLRPRDPRLAVEAFGRRFPSPLGVAAGLDKAARTYEQLGRLGFGFVEVGTVTFHAQEGNPKPRVWRLVGARAIVNAMGFPNPGAADTARRLRRARRDTVVGVNIGKSRVVELEDAVADYASATAVVGPLADFLVLNVSSPNTPGLRDLQDVTHLATLLDGVRGKLRELGAAVPVLLKIAPDLSDEQIDAVADFALAQGLDGLIATNTTIARDGLGAEPAELPGGVSGAPLKARSLEVLQRLHDRVGERIPLISVGGVESADDVWERIAAGATLVQAYTGFVYGGPLWPRRINRGLSERLDASGAGSLAEVRGSARRDLDSRQCPAPEASST
ncbi:MAG TPA: quinone-dependent dihydroorotate dehydrogenase [Capillimicrobium sp.]|nr:quinone-dependent dihydroorotate dehydrogenase [Capillimicrobium sp.]